MLRNKFSKIILIMLVMLVLASASLFAANTSGAGAVTSGTTTTRDALATILQNTVKYVFGYALGGILLVKFGIDLVGAIMKKDQDPTAVKKALIGFVATLVVVLAWQPILSTILTSGTRSSAISGDEFVKGLLQADTLTT